ncbi:MAG: hypothetical protein ACR2QZ_02560 [Woeseiaceae bacterium]
MNIGYEKLFQQFVAFGTAIGASLLFTANNVLADDNPDTPRLHPLEQYCVTFDLAGMMSGTWTECARDYAFERVELQNMVIQMGPITQTDNKRVVYVGPQIYTIPENGNAMVADNPMFDSTVAALEDSDPMTLSSNMLGSMGFTPNGETMEFLGYSCNVAAGQMGTICMTDNGLTLYMNTMGQTRTATSIDLDSGGNDEYYSIPENPQQAPDLSDLGNLLQGLGNQD